MEEKEKILNGYNYLETLCKIANENPRKAKLEFDLVVKGFLPNFNDDSTIPLTTQLLRFLSHGFGFQGSSNQTYRYDTIFPLLSKFAIVPPDSSECERIFSTLKRVKSNERSKMSQESLNSVLRIKHFFSEHVFCWVFRASDLFSIN